ncbi:cellulase family glycosylhydrolase [Sphingomonas xinjiangensis]|nr:cellulase family glycosylhydrolase [Sphingomonas xinjiangensis]
MILSRIRKLAAFSAVSAVALAISAYASRSGDALGEMIVPAASSPQIAISPPARAPAAALSVMPAQMVAQQSVAIAAPATALFGANLSGAEAKDSDAVRPSFSDLQGYIDHFGFKLIRYPFKDSRMTPARINELRTLTEHARSRGVRMILDNHTYQWTSVQQQVSFWTTFARNFSDDGSVVLDLVNEPGGFNDPVLTNDWMQWIRDAKLIIAGLRKNGIKHPIAIQYPQWSATFRFDKAEPASTACESAGCAIDRDKSGPIDPLNRTYINAHRYWDKGSSGTNRVCETTWGASSGLDGFAAQLRKRGLKGYVTEAAFGSSYSVDKTCVGIGKDAIADIKANSDVLLGITWWGGGRVWPESYHFKIEPAKATRFTSAIPTYTRQLLGQR